MRSFLLSIVLAVVSFSIAGAQKVLLIGNHHVADSVLEESGRFDQVDYAILDTPSLFESVIYDDPAWVDPMLANDYDFVIVQTLGGNSMDEAAAIGVWMSIETQAKFILHSGWHYDLNAHDDIREPSSEPFVDAVHDRVNMFNDPDRIVQSNLNEITFVFGVFSLGYGAPITHGQLFIHVPDRPFAASFWGQYLIQNTLLAAIDFDLNDQVNDSRSEYLNDLILHCNPITGDLNNDGAVTFLDISPFVPALSSLNPYNPQADMNGDGIVSFLDIGLFIDRLSR